MADDNTLTQEERGALGLTLVEPKEQTTVDVPVKRVNESGLSREKIDLGLSQQFRDEAEAKSIIKMHISQQLNVHHSTLDTDKAIQEYFGVDEGYDAKELYEVLSTTAKLRVEPDKYSGFVNLSSDEQVEVALKDTFELDEEGKPVGQVHGEGSRKRLVELHKSKLRNNSKSQWLRYIDSELDNQPTPSRMRKFVVRSLMRGDVNIAEYNSLSTKDKAFFADYLALSNPERAITMLDNAGISVKRGGSDIWESLKKTAVFQTMTPGYDRYDQKYIYSTLSSLDPAWEKRFDKDGNIKTAQDKQELIMLIGEHRFKSWIKDQVSEQLFGADRAEGGLQELYRVKRSEFIEDTRNGIDDLYTAMKAGKYVVDSDREAYKIRQAVRKRYNRGEGVKGVINNRVASVVPMAMDLSVVVALSRVNPAAGAVYSAARFQGDFAEQMVYEYGFSEDESRRWAGIAAVPYAAVEVLQGKQLEKSAMMNFRAAFSKSYRKSLGTTMTKVMTQLGLKHTKNTVMEIGEEGVQKIIEQSAILALEDIEKTGNVDERQLIKDFRDEMLEAAKSMPFLTGGAAVAGTAASVASDFSQTRSLKGMLDKWSMEVEESKLREGMPSSDMSIKDEINLMDSGDMELYRSAETDEQRVQVLDDAGISDPSSADAILQTDEDIMSEYEQARQDILMEAAVEGGVVESGADIEQQEARYNELRTVMEGLGVEEKIVTELTDNLDPQNVGQLLDNMIEIVDSSADPQRVFNHEVFEWLDRSGAIEEGDWKAFRKALDKPEYKELKLRYADLQGDAQVKDVMADAWAGWSPDERGVVQRVFDYIRKVLGIVSEKDVFRKLDTYLKEAKAVEQKLPEPSGTPVDIPKRFARGERTAVQNLQDAAEMYALAKADGRDVEKVADSLSERSGRPAEDIAARGEQLFRESTERLEAGAGRQEKRVAVRKKALRDSAMVEARRARKEGIELAKKAEKAEKRLEGRNRAAERKLRRAVPTKKSPAHLLKAVLTNDADTFLDEMQADADKFAEEEGVTESKTKDSVYKHTISKNIWQIVSQLPWDRNRSYVQNKLASLREDSTKIETANTMARDIIERLHRIDSLAKQKTIASKIKKLLKTEVGKKPADKTLRVDREIGEDEHAMLSIIGNLFGKTEDSVDSMLSDIEAFEKGSQDVDATTGMARKVEGYIPHLKNMQGLDESSKIAYAKAMIDTWGALSKQGTPQLADAMVAIEDMLNEAKQEQLVSAREQSNKYKKGTTLLRLGTQNKSGKKALITGSPVFQEISMRMRELALFSSARGKTAMNEFIGMLKFQESSDAYNKVMREGAQSFHDALRKNYKGTFIDKIVIGLNSKKKAYAKHNLVDGTAMSKAQLMQLVTTYRQDEYKGNMRAMGYNDEVMTKIESELSSSDQNFIVDLYDIYQELGVPMDAVARSLWGIDISNKGPWYLPVTVDSASEWNGVDVRTVPVAPPSTTRRISHNKPIDISMGITEMWDSRMSQTASFIAYGESNALAKAVLSDEQSVRSIEKTFGKTGVWKGLKNHLNDIFSNGGGDAFRSDALRKTLNALTLRALSGNLKMPFVQLTSAPSYALQFGSLNFAKMVGSGVVNPEGYINSMKAIVKSDQFKDRITIGGTEFMESALRERFGVSSLDMIPAESARDAAKFMGSLIKRMYRYGMMTNKVGDVGPILLLAPAIHLDEMRKTGDAKEAMTNTWEVINLTQQSYATKNRSALSRRGGVLGKVLSAFTTTPGQFMAYESQAFRALSAKVQTDGYSALKSPEMRKMLDTLFINHILLPGMYYTVSTLLSNFIRGDEWDEDDTNGMIIAMLTGPFAAWAIFAGLTKDFLNSAMDGNVRSFGGILPIDSFRNDARLLGEVIKHGIEGDFDEMLESAGEELKNIITPYKQVSSAVENR